MKALVVTVGSKYESLGAAKLAAWLRGCGHAVDTDTTIRPMFGRWCLVALSAVFSWRLPMLVQLANQAKLCADKVWIGGPAVTFHDENRRWVEKHTGIRPHVGLDERFESQETDCGMVHFSRGCPAYTSACGFCPVPKIEGKTFTFYPDARPAKLLLDNNLSALPVDYQEHIIRRYRDDWRGGAVDANSGFEPHSFDGGTLGRWSRFPLKCWRMGYDDLSERYEALAAIRLLKSAGHTGERVRVYCLVGNEPIEACHQRVREIIELGAHPVPQRLRPLNWRSGPLPTFYDWDEPTLIAFQRFYSLAGLWGRMRPMEFYYQKRRPLARLGG